MRKLPLFFLALQQKRGGGGKWKRRQCNQQDTEEKKMSTVDTVATWRVTSRVTTLSLSALTDLDTAFCCHCYTRKNITMMILALECSFICYGTSARNTLLQPPPTPPQPQTPPRQQKTDSPPSSSSLVRDLIVRKQCTRSFKHDKNRPIHWTLSLFLSFLLLTSVAEFVICTQWIAPMGFQLSSASGYSLLRLSLYNVSFNPPFPFVSFRLLLAI